MTTTTQAIHESACDRQLAETLAAIKRNFAGVPAQTAEQAMAARSKLLSDLDSAERYAASPRRWRRQQYGS